VKEKKEVGIVGQGFRMDEVLWFSDGKSLGCQDTAAIFYHIIFLVSRTSL
jgi:hypothetical protein